MAQDRSDKARLSADRLQAAWRERSLRGGWSLPRDWWLPEVDDVTQAVAGDGGALAAACERLGRSRARAGVGIGETIDDLGALFRELRSADPPLSMVRAAAEGWTESGLAGLNSCVDPLTGLVTVAYLRSRLEEIYRAASAVPVCESHCLVVMDLESGGDPWRRLLRSAMVGDGLREIFTGGETLALLRPGRAAVLAKPGPELELQSASLRVAVRSGHVRVERLPLIYADAMRLLDRLAALGRRTDAAGACASRRGGGTGRRRLLFDWHGPRRADVRQIIA